MGVGADLEPATLLHAYASGLFPMPLDRPDVIGWFSPAMRGVLEFDDLRVSRSLRQSCRRYTISVNAAFNAVIEECASLDRDGGWITPNVAAAYIRLHELGWAHSVETWLDDTLVGGLYGVQIGGLFAGESMFHRERDASKVALVGLVSALEARGATVIDVQWATEHLATLGVSQITRSDYHERLAEALASPAPPMGSADDPFWVTKSPRYLDRLVPRPKEDDPVAPGSPPRPPR